MSKSDKTEKRVKKPKKSKKRKSDLNSSDTEPETKNPISTEKNVDKAEVEPTNNLNEKNVAPAPKIKKPLITTDPTKLVEIITKSLDPSNGPSMEIVSSESESTEGCVCLYIYFIKIIYLCNICN